MDKYDSLPPLREVIHEYGLRAEKSLGQNFILDQNLTDKIVRKSGNISSAHVIEIGPGPGGLTRSILRSNPLTLTAIEYDERAVNALTGLIEASDGKLKVIKEDALRADVTQVAPEAPRIIIANLPYNIATTLLINWLKQIREDHHTFESMTLMFQKEVAERIVAKPNTKAYGRLSIISQWLCETSMLFDLPPSAFVPPPKVTSSVVHFTPRILNYDAPNFEKVEKITASAFNQRRKMIRSSLKEYAEILQTSGIDETKRAENLTIEEYIKLSDALD